MSAAAGAGLGAVQRRTVRTLSAAQVCGGIGNGAAISVGALLIKDVSGSSAWAGLATTMLALGAALSALPLAALAASRGRRPSLTVGWAGAVVGAVVVIVGARADALALCLLGMLICGFNSATNLQSRYAAVDLADASNVGRSLSIVVWSTTIGAVLGPNLTAPGAAIARPLGVPELAGPFVFAAAAWVAGATIMYAALRPDPLVTAKDARATTGTGPPGRGIGKAWPIVRRTPVALTGIVTVACAHAFMVGVMAMTPVYMQDHGAMLSIVGLTISLHIAGMFALSPVMGVLADRWGRVRTVALGQATLLGAALTAGTAGDSTVRITLGLVLLGLGWSASLIAGSAMVADAVAVTERPGVQGLSDLAMNLSGALGGVVAGLVVGGFGFGPLNAVAALLVMPVLWRIAGTGRTAAPAG